MLTRLLIILTVFSSSLCHAQSLKKVKIKKGSWISSLSLSDEDVLPFEMTIEKNKKEYVFTVINGDEKIKLSAHELKGDSLKVAFPFFNSAIIFKPSKKHLSGFWYNYNKGKNYKIPFTSKRSKESRFGIDSGQDNNTPVTGSWKVTFEPNTNSSYPAVGVFQESESNKVLGTFLTETGDYRYLSGQATNDSLYLSCFDGSHAFLFKASKTDTSMIGRFFSGNHWSSEWVAVKNDSFQLTNPDDLTYIIDEKTFAFNLMDINGQPFSFPNERYKDKVVIIQIMGSWCPNCLDETQYYKELYQSYHNSGLEIISIGYETGNSFEDYASNITRLKNKLNLDFTFLVGGPANKNTASQQFSMLNEVISFPTSIFIGRDGEIKRVHTGFNGPGTGNYYIEYVQKTNSLIESLLAE
jgi:thiol-disulfide isomerase/thioredoxin